MNEQLNADTASRDIFWLRDENPKESDNLSDPDILAREIEQFREIARDIAANKHREGY